MTRGQRAYWLLVAVTLAVYATMLLWSLPKITAAAGGLVPFDLRPAGYTVAEARAFLAALSPVGVAFYRTVQQRLDLFYPGLLAATLLFAFARLMPQRLGAGRWLLAASVLLVAAFDYAENAAVAVLLTAGPDASEQLVLRASAWTVLKSAATTVAALALLGLALWRGLRRRVVRRRARG